LSLSMQYRAQALNVRVDLERSAVVLDRMKSSVVCRCKYHAHALNVHVDLERSAAVLGRMKSAVVSVER
jgi:nucleotidyltransferase/DNA polymerase involved in DNA repair